VSAGPTPPHAALPPTASPPTASPPTASPPTASPPTAPAAARPQPSGSQTPRAWLTMMLVAAVVLAIGWSGLRMLTAHSTQVPPRPPVETSAGSASPTEADGTKTAGVVQRPASAVSTAKPGRGDVATSPSALHEVTPDVPWGARRTIRGHIRVWVRVIVNEDGSVFAAVADRSGPSSYFERLSIEAAKKWTFPPVDTPSQRMMQVRFDFTRDGATGHAVKLH